MWKNSGKREYFARIQIPKEKLRGVIFFFIDSIIGLTGKIFPDLLKLL